VTFDSTRAILQLGDRHHVRSGLCDMKFKTILLFSALMLAACGRPSGVLQRLRMIPASPQNLPADAARRPVPKVEVTARGAFILTEPGLDTTNINPVPFEDVLKQLSELPLSAWTLGRVIYYGPPCGFTSESPPRPQDRDRLLRMEADFKLAGIRCEPLLGY
jgi:hypothetical protein